MSTAWASIESVASSSRSAGSERARTWSPVLPSAKRARPSSRAASPVGRYQLIRDPMADPGSHAVAHERGSSAGSPTKSADQALAKVAAEVGCIDAYSEQESTSSSCLPSPATLPRSRTMMRSARDAARRE